MSSASSTRTRLEAGTLRETGRSHQWSYNELFEPDPDASVSEKGLAEAAGVQEATVMQLVQLLRAEGISPPTRGRTYPSWAKSAVKEMARELLELGLMRRTVSAILVDICRGIVLPTRVYLWVEETASAQEFGQRVRRSDGRTGYLHGQPYHA